MKVQNPQNQPNFKAIKIHGNPEKIISIKNWNEILKAAQTHTVLSGANNKDYFIRTSNTDPKQATIIKAIRKILPDFNISEIDDALIDAELPRLTRPAKEPLPKKY